MSRYAAFLRGINLGRRRVTGDELRKPFENIGFAGVSTFLASGNVVFETQAPGETDALTERIEGELEATLGFPVDVFLRTAGELEAMAGHRPFPADELEGSGGKLQIMMLRGRPSPETEAELLSLATTQDRLALDGKELYWLPAGRMTDSGLDLKAVERLVGSNTMRTANTVRRIWTKFFEPHR